MGLSKFFVAGGTSDLDNRVVKETANSFKPENVTCLICATSKVVYLKSLGGYDI